MAPQSGHVHWIPLQVIPQKFSSMQSEQIMKPQGQVQQKICSCEHAVQMYLSGRRHLPLRPDFSRPFIFTFLKYFSSQFLF
jgi:hypothetical protein